MGRWGPSCSAPLRFTHHVCVATLLALAIFVVIF